MTGYQSKRAAAQDKLDSMEREALKLAQQVMESLPGFRADIDNALDAIKEALAQPEHEALPSTLSIWDRPVYQPPTMATPRPGASDHLHVRSRGV